MHDYLFSFRCNFISHVQNHTESQKKAFTKQRKREETLNCNEIASHFLVFFFNICRLFAFKKRAAMELWRNGLDTLLEEDEPITISMRAGLWTSSSVFLWMALRSREYLVSRCIGLTRMSIKRSRLQSRCVSHHCVVVKREGETEKPISPRFTFQVAPGMRRESVNIQAIGTPWLLTKAFQLGNTRVSTCAFIFVITQS
jgi:hypothetical protein